MSPNFSRRYFFYGSLLAGAIPTGGFGSIPSLLGAGYKSPNEKLNIASIGAGGKASSDIDGCRMENIVALCDVDDKQAAAKYKQYPDTPKFKDFRKMLDAKGGDIDACIVTIPDFMHATAAIACMERGKHVYVQKPLVHTVAEARLMLETAQKNKVATQMGNQGYSNEGTRQAAEIVWSGQLGNVTEVHAWTDRPWWPQGLTSIPAPDAVPATLDWDLWQGALAKRPYTSGGAGYPNKYGNFYQPFNWRGFFDFGCGAIGDMACHILGAPIDQLVHVAAVLGGGKAAEALTLLIDGAHAQHGVAHEASLRARLAAKAAALPAAAAAERVVTATQREQTSASGTFAGVKMGAFTWALTAALGQGRTTEEQGVVRLDVSYGELVVRARALLGALSFEQVPGFLGGASTKDRAFLHHAHPAPVSPAPTKHGVSAGTSPAPGRPPVLAQLEPDLWVLSYEDELGAWTNFATVNVTGGTEYWIVSKAGAAALSSATAIKLSVVSTLPEMSGTVAETTSEAVSWSQHTNTSYPADTVIFSGEFVYDKDGHHGRLSIAFELTEVDHGNAFTTITWFNPDTTGNYISLAWNEGPVTLAATSGSYTGTCNVGAAAMTIT